MKSSVLRLADALGAARFYRWRNRRLLPILMYHGVISEPLRAPCWHMLSEREFTQQLEWMARRYTVLPLENALERLRAGDLPPGCAAITFDDGYLNNRSVALPVLQRLGLPATIFVVTSLVGTEHALWPDRLWLLLTAGRVASADFSGLGLGILPLSSVEQRGMAYVRVVTALKSVPASVKDAHLHDLERAAGEGGQLDPGPFRLLTWSDVRDLQSTGLVTFGAHTTHHEILRQQDDADVARAVRDSQERLTRETGRSARVFAYPNGRTLDFDERARRAVAQAGIPFALSTAGGLAGRTDDPLALPRVSVGARTAAYRFRLQISGALMRSRKT